MWSGLHRRAGLELEQPVRVVLTQQRRVSLHIVYAKNFDSLLDKIATDSECLRVALGARFVRDGLQKRLPAVTDQ